MTKHILAIHGAYSSPFIFNYLRKELPSDYTWQFFDYRKEPEGHMTSLIDKLEKSIDQECHVVGHSLGGVLALWLGENMAVRSITTVATPLDGLDLNVLLTYMSKSPYVREIANGSRFINHIHEVPYMMPVQHIISTKGYNPYINEECDGVVTLRSQRGWSAGEVHEIPANHSEVMMHDDTVRLLKEFIDKNQD